MFDCYYNPNDDLSVILDYQPERSVDDSDSAMVIHVFFQDPVLPDALEFTARDHHVGQLCLHVRVQQVYVHR